MFDRFKALCIKELSFLRVVQFSKKKVSYSRRGNDGQEIKKMLVYHFTFQRILKGLWVKDNSVY